MKIFMFLIFLGVSTSSFTQTYLDLNSEWKEHSVACGGGNPFCSSIDYTIRLDGDTIIDNMAYFKTRRQGIVTVWNWVTGDTISQEVSDLNLWPIREESGKFYVYNPVDEEDQLLHNFKLTVGDTAIARTWCSKPQIVMAIDTVYFGSQIRKKFIFGQELSFGNSFLYEGIGTDRGLFEKPCYGSVGIESGSTLQCYSANNYEILQIDTSGQCETTLPVNVKDPIFREPNIYPNPFNEIITIENSFTESSMLNIKIYDFNGRLVKTSSTLNSGNTIKISTKEIVSGIYILALNTDTNFYVTKIIKF
ncbi:MAG TPA: T9SS type A sorting domain-containing protein [Saprospiraceae bacterium]|nr:T9SS type A sorting domain-containing protein [Saprospiraceae bacterium]HMU03146.1 T9SS type A sorting domain-containing protein [Saprospiraceae bacterium]